MSFTRVHEHLLCNLSHGRAHALPAEITAGVWNTIRDANLSNWNIRYRDREVAKLAIGRLVCAFP